MTTSTWNGASADWYTNNGGDWTPAGDPGPSSAVVINSGEPELVSGDAAISVASIAITGGLLAIQDPGVTQAVSGNVSVTGNGALQLDGNNIGGPGGSSMTIGGTLTNSSSNGNAISIGNGNITSADTLTVNGSGGLTSTGQIDIEGSATVQATLNVANAAAGFGTAGTETGNVYMQGDALLEFKSGEISTVDGVVQLNGANARIADAGSTSSNSALTGLTTVAGDFWLQNGATVSPTSNVSITGNGTIELDGNNIGGAGGTSLTIGGTLTNSSSNGNALSIGNGNITSADTLTVNGTGGLVSTGQIDIEGSATVQATLNVANAAAGFGTAGTETGNVYMQGDALLEFKSGEISTVDGAIQLNGANARIADAGSTSTNSALTGLTTVAGDFWLQNGASVSPTSNVSITGNGTIELDGNNIGGAGGTSLTIGGTLTNSSSNGNALSIGNGNITSADTLTVNGSGGLTSTGQIDIEGSATVQATLNVANAAAGFGTAGTETGNVYMQGDALLEFKSGEISTVDGVVQLNGANARIADAGSTSSNSALTGLTTVAGDFWLQNGATVSPTSNVSITGNGTIELDGNNIGGAGGTSLTIGGTLTNSSSNGNALSIGNGNITSADTLTVNGTGGLVSTGQIDIEGSATVQATLNVANAAAGFGTAGTETGNVYMQGDALLEFKSGEISTVDGAIQLNGANARIADAGSTSTNSALTGLTTVAGNFWLQNGATVSPTGALTITGNGTVELDGNNEGGGGGSSLTIGGKLTNSSSNGNGVSIGNTGITSADTLTVNGVLGLSNTGEISIEGSATVQATLDVADHAAGFGTTGVETGTVFLQNDALLEFKSGQITTIDGQLQLDGANARVARAAAPATNSALTGLTTVSGNFWLANGATVSPTGNVSITGNGTVELDGNNEGGGGGSTLTITGTLTNSSTNGNGISIGNTGITSADTLTVRGAGGLSNTGEINIEGSATVQATLDVADDAAGFGTTGVETGTVFLQNDALLEFESGQITTIDGQLQLDGAKARVARAAAPATNSALTGLTTVSGNFWLENGATVSPTGNVSVTGNGTMELDGNNEGGGGGSTLTITGTLTNSSTNGNGISIGNTGITSADTLTVKGSGGLSNTGEINIVGGSATAIGTLDVTDTATSSGTIVIGAFGDLTATAVDVTGGSLQGVGTVTGTLNDTGGTVGGGGLNGSTGTLNVSGAYEQSGSGVLQTDINTGDSQQSSIIAVTGTPGTPGAAGSVNLEGGTLLIEAETSLALNTPYTVMTFGAGDLYGQFAQVETEGALGSFTGNGDSVTLSGGDTLEVLYNEAAGDIQVEVVATPSSTTYDWDIGSGTWNASSGADWNPPNNGTTPSQTSNVEIGTGGGGTVTLAADQTINSLSVTNGYTLSGAAKSITTVGNVSVASGAVLSIDNMNVGGAFTDSGSATFAGVLTVISGGSFTLSGGTLSGGINGTGTFETATGGSGTLSSVTIYKGTTYTTTDTNSTTDITGAIGGGGTLQVDGGSDANGFLVLTGATTLSGGGALSLATATGGGSAFVQGNGETLTNASDAIEGTGAIGNGSLKLINGGTIDANSSAGIGTLILDGSGGTTNVDGSTSGLMEATSGGTLDIDGITIDNAIGAVKGRITANGGTVELVSGAVVEGGTLTSSNSGTLETGIGQTATLNGTAHLALTISAGSTYTTTDSNSTTDITGAITDNGTLQVNGGSDANGTLNLTGATTLSGSGAVSLTTATGGGEAFVEGNSETLTSADTIEGSGEIGNGSLTLINSGTIDANLPSSSQTGQTNTGILILNGSGGITNANGATAGLLEATNSGTLQIAGITVNNDTGAITANGGVVELVSATIQGGTLNELNGGTLGTQSGDSATLDGSTHGALTISAGSTYTTTDSNSTTEILGTITDKGTLQVNGGSDANGTLALTAATTLNGGGAVVLATATGGGQAYISGNSQTLTNADVIDGAGTIGNSSLTLINSGTIDANSAVGTGTLILNGSGGVTNTNLMEATNGGTLQISGITVNNTGGAITANGGAVQVMSATIQGGTLNASNSGTLGTTSGTSTLDGKTDGALTISSGSTYTTSNGTATDILGTITDKGTIQVNGGGDNNGYLNLTQATTLSGGGTVSLATATGGGDANLEGSGETLTNSDTIQGTGQIGNGSLTLINGGTIDANSSAGIGVLILNGSGGITNANGGTAGLIEATSGGTLQINGITVDNAGANITANGGAVQLNTADIQGGTLNVSGGGTMGTTSGTVTLDGSTEGALTISAGSTYTASNNTATDILGTITDKGTIALSGGGDANGYVNLTGNATLNGGGLLTLTTATGGGNANLEGSGETLTNSDTIQGTGQIGNSSLTLINGGTIDANSSAGIGLLLLSASGGITNANGATAGLIEATSSGTLQIDDITVNNDTGAITANGGAVQMFSSATIQGGTLNTSSGGTMGTTSGTVTLDGSTHGALTISAGSTYTASNNTITDILGTITDKGTIALSGGSDANGYLNLTGATTLNGGGTVTLTTATGGGDAFIEGGGETLTNADTIQGTGVIGNGSLALTSSGTIDADSSAGIGSLTLNGSGGITNTGVFEATGGGYLDVADALGGAGTLKIGANSTVELGGATSENATFLSATAATLLIDNATTAGEYSGVLNSFAVGDILELGNTNATSAAPTSYNGTDTTLTVDLSSGGPLTYTLAGDYMSDTFSVTHVGSNSEITDPAFEEAASLLGGHTASPFVESSGVFGASNTVAQHNLTVSPHAHS